MKQSLVIWGNTVLVCLGLYAILQWFWHAFVPFTPTTDGLSLITLAFLIPVSVCFANWPK